VRIDTGVEQGSVISSFYDPMIAKVIVHADDRQNARVLLADKLEGLAVWPVKSNAGFLHRAATHPVFAAGDVTTAFIPQYLEELLPPEAPGPELLRRAAYELQRQYLDDEWPYPVGFRLNARAVGVVRMQFGGKRFAVVPAGDEEDGVYSSRAAPDLALVTQDGQSYAIGLDRGEAGEAGTAADGALISPMPGKIIAVEVRQGDVVAKGQKLLTLEAMKMEHSLAAPFDGVVAELNAAEGGQVSEGTLLARIEKGEG
jgi:3-methylcrotonyl-CoA carboxylase alpha subunit